MMKSQQSGSSLTKQSNVFRLFGFVAAVGGVAVGAGAMAVGLIVPSWDIFKSSPKIPSPAKTLALTARPSKVPAAETAPQSVELVVRTEKPSQNSDESTTSPPDRTPAASLQDAESNANSEPLPDTNVPTAPPAIVPQQPQVSSAVGTTSQDSETPLTTSSVATTSPTSPPEAESKPPAQTQPHDLRTLRSVQNFAPVLPEHKPRSHSGPTIGQRMWYK
jgi:hypothetical protein